MPPQLKAKITMNNSTYTLEELMKIDEAIAEMKRHPIDYSDIPPMKPGTKVRLANKAWLDSQPREVVLELGRQRLKQMIASGYKVPASLEYLLQKDGMENPVDPCLESPQRQVSAVTAGQS
jgi:hypothetical protein